MAVLKNEGCEDTLYRGQANKEWDLIPSIYRPCAEGVANLACLKDWKNRACRFVSAMPRDDIEWLVLAQHYGLATPLLDWTVSPLVALFFACDDPHKRDLEGCVWSAAPENFNDDGDTMMISAFGDEFAKPFLINAIGRNARSTVQDSFLSLHSDGNLQALGAKRIFYVAAEDKVETLKVLAILGINNERLHCDISRLVDRLKDKWLYDPQWTK